MYERLHFQPNTADFPLFYSAEPHFHPKRSTICYSDPPPTFPVLPTFRVFVVPFRRFDRSRK